MREQILVRHLGEYPIHDYLEDLLQRQLNGRLQFGQNVRRVLVQEQIHIVAQHAIAVEQIRKLNAEPLGGEVQLEFVRFDVLATVLREQLRFALDDDVQVVEVQARSSVTLDGQHKDLALDGVETGERYLGDVGVHFEFAFGWIGIEATKLEMELKWNELVLEEFTDRKN